MKEIIRLREVNKTFTSEKGHNIEALQDINLSIEESQFICLLGPSGSGKSTLLRLMAGLMDASEGEVEVMGKSIKKPISEASMVFQEYSLLPWRNIIDNVAFGLEVRKVPKKEGYAIARNILGKFGLEGFEKNYPYELSGGMQQRAAIARAMAVSPEILYMDEPFGALDAHTRLQMQQELISFWLKDKRTIVFVTHSVEEAIFLGTRIIVMSSRPGRIIEDFQIDLPYPRDRWSGKFGHYFNRLMDLMNGKSSITEEYSEVYNQCNNL
ncbi:MAG: ABC transporter ATP-binding protein [Clostridiaceae bacterium]|nr:ABC transporter ATP-binding protein [Clostridiaceae bacterium]